MLVIFLSTTQEDWKRISSSPPSSSELYFVSDSRGSTTRVPAIPRRLLLYLASKMCVVFRVFPLKRYADLFKQFANFVGRWRIITSIIIIWRIILIVYPLVFPILLICDRSYGVSLFTQETLTYVSRSYPVSISCSGTTLVNLSSIFSILLAWEACKKSCLINHQLFYRFQGGLCGHSVHDNGIVYSVYILRLLLLLLPQNRLPHVWDGPRCILYHRRSMG